jgi:hypothetical protein
MTRIGQVSQIAARADQSTAVAPTPKLRNRADAALAIAREIERKELVWQVKQGIAYVIGRRGAFARVSPPLRGVAAQAGEKTSIPSGGPRQRTNPAKAPPTTFSAA